MRKFKSLKEDCTVACPELIFHSVNACVCVRVHLGVCMCVFHCACICISLLRSVCLYLHLLSLSPVCPLAVSFKITSPPAKSSLIEKSHLQCILICPTVQRNDYFVLFVVY